MIYLLHLSSVSDNKPKDVALSKPPEYTIYHHSQPHTPLNQYPNKNT